MEFNVQLSFGRRWISVLILLCLFGYSTQQLNIVQPIAVRVSENTHSITRLGCITCTNTVNPSLPVLVRKTGITNQFQGGDAFDVYDFTGSGEYCVYYMRSQAVLNHGVHSSYTMDIVCTDGVGSTPETAQVFIQVTTNEPPQLSEPAACPEIDAQGTSASATVYNTLLNAVDDPDNDNIFCYMTVFPPTENFEIDPYTCLIRAKNNLNMECNPSVTFRVMVYDNVTTPNGPLVITCPLTNHLLPPNVPNLNDNITLREDTSFASSTPFFTMQNPYTVPNNFPPVTYRIKATSPDSAGSVFAVERDSLVLNEHFDYENFEFRDVNLTITADNGFCAPVDHYLNIHNIEVNEPPVLDKDFYYEEVNEEGIFVNPNYICDDPEDGINRCTYRIISGNQFNVDSRTGVITSQYNIDNQTPEVNETIILEASDSEGLKTNTTVFLRIRDINDQRPYFKNGGNGLTFTVTECTNPGTLPVTFEGCDDDSAYRGNNVTFFRSSNNSDCLFIGADGTVTLKRMILLSDPVCTETALLVDSGEYPRSLTATSMAQIVVTTSECPPVVTDPPATAPPDTNTGGNTNNGATTTVAIVVTAIGGNAASSNFTWLAILAPLLGALLLGLLGLFCCRRFCCKTRKPTPLSSDQAKTKKKKKFDALKKKKKAAAGAAAGAAATVAAPNLIQRFLRIRRRIPFMRVKRRVPIQTVRSLVPVRTTQVVSTGLRGPTVLRSAPAPVVQPAGTPIRQVLPASQPYPYPVSAPLTVRR